MQAYIRDPAAPTMADKGVLANVAIHEGGHAQGTLGQASRLRDLVRSMTPTKILGEVTIGGMFGGGRLFVGEGEQQDSLKVVALTPLRVAAVSAEQLVIESPGNTVEELRNYLAFQMTYWLSRCNMISKHVRCPWNWTNCTKRRRSGGLARHTRCSVESVAAVARHHLPQGLK